MSTEEVSKVSNDDDGTAGFWFVLLGFSLLLHLGCGFSFAHMLNGIYNELHTKARIIKANRLVVAQIVQYRDGHWTWNHKGGKSWKPPTMQLSYDYENKNYLVWKDNLDKHAFSQRSTHCNVYIDPYNPNKYVLQEGSSECTGYVFSICFFLSTIAGGGGIYYFMLLGANASEIISMKVGWVLFGCANVMPLILLICYRCCRTLFQYVHYSVSGVEETAGIEFKNLPNLNSVESTTFTETEIL